MFKRCITTIVLSVIYISAADASMPTLAEKPKIISLSECKLWAQAQDDDAIEMWGVVEDGTSSKLIAFDRLTNECLGRPTPDIVGFWSSAGFDRDYCKNHRAIKLCKDAVSGVARVSPASCMGKLIKENGKYLLDGNDGLCLFSKADTKQVMAICSIGKQCEIFGEEGNGGGEDAKEIVHITAVRK